MCQKVEDMILQDHHVKVIVTAHELDISAGTVSSINHSIMMSKVSSLLVPQMLTPEQKACLQQFSEENLDIGLLRASPENFFSRIITGDETWVHDNYPKTKQESMQWKYKWSPTPKNFVRNNQPERSWQEFFGTQMVFCFWNSCHTGQPLLENLCFHNGGFTLEYQTETPRGKLSAGALLLHYNAPAHKSRTSRAAVRK